MTAVDLPQPRIVTLDIVRGVAVMGILAMNIVAFAMPPAAYMNPRAYGTEGLADLTSWLFSFLFIDGRMRGLFSFLFGASLLLVIQRAEAAGASPASVHFCRMIWLLVFGLIHFYLVWYGDILSLYAPVGMIAYLFRRSPPRQLVAWAVGLLAFQFVLMAGLSWWFTVAQQAAAAPGADQETMDQWREMSRGIGLYSATDLSAVMTRFRGPWLGMVNHMIREETLEPVKGLALFGWETLAYMLLGMAALETGFLTGQWGNRDYRRVMAIGFGIGLPVYALCAWLLLDSDFAVPSIFIFALTATVPFRPLMIGATAAMVILLTRRCGRLTRRIASAGRAAFTNYLGTSLLMTGLFYGWGLGWFGELSRAELWLVVAVAWLIMLTWSKPWLDRYRFGPFEWLWRSLARGTFQPMRLHLPT